MVFEQVYVDLENEGYEVQSFIIPACAVNAPHRRDRLWIVAHTQHNGSYQAQRNAPKQSSNRQENRLLVGDFRHIKEPTQPPVCSSDDGIPGGVARLKALGNAVVPQIPELIGRAILVSLNKY